MLKPIFIPLLFSILLLFNISCNHKKNRDAENVETSVISKEKDTIVKEVGKDVFFTSDKMNIFYKGVDMSLSISVPGTAADMILVSISNGSISKSEKGSYLVHVKSGEKTVISVSVIMPDGTNKLIVEEEFLVKTVPDPKPYFAGKSTHDDKVKKNELTAAQGVVAKMQNFDFDLKFTIVSFKLTMSVSGTLIEKVSNSNRVTGEMKQMLKKAKPGSKIYIENIKAQGSDGTVRKLGALSFKVI